VKRSLKFTVVCALAGMAIMASATGAGAHAGHVTRLRGTATGVDQLGADDSCSGIYATGTGTTQSNLGAGSYSENICAVPNSRGTRYRLTGTYTSTSSEGDINGTVTGLAVYSERDGYYHYDIAISVDGGTQAFTGAQGRIRVRGTGEFDYENGLALDDSLSFRGVIKV
jgi:hypothetical protein